MKTGRKHKSRVIRDKTTGRSRGEPQDAIMAVAKVYRTREVGEQDWSNALAGFTLGKLRLRGRTDRTDPSGISEDQFLAGERWAEICRRHSAIHGYPIGPKGPSMSFVGGASLSAPPDEDAILSLRRQWTACYDSLMAAGVDFRVGVRIATLCWDVCVANKPVEHLYGDDFGLLRIGLNTLKKILG